MNRTYRTLSTMLGGLVAVTLAIASPSAWADDDDDEIEFDEHEIFFELNYTDEDLGIHALIDGDAWKRTVEYCAHEVSATEPGNAGLYGRA